MAPTSLRAESDDGLRARVVARRVLRYRGGADRALDRPAFVRAGSALAWLGDRLIVVQDDVAFLGIVEIETGLVDDIPFDAGAGGARTFDARRGNKADKLDLEAAFVDGDAVVALGSGGPLPARRRVVTWRPGAPPRATPVPRLYDALEPWCVADGWAVNVEGAVVLGDRLVLAQRGGHSARGPSPDVLMWLDLEGVRALLADPASAPVPPVDAIVCDLGGLAGTGAPLHFTDLAPWRDGAALYVASAEATASWFDDGAIAGSAVGVLAPGTATPLRHASVFEADGALALDKLEGVAAWPGHPGRLLAASDPDDPDGHSSLVELAVDGLPGSLGAVSAARA